MQSWHLLSGEYPPQQGGVADYSRLVARGLAEAGDQVAVSAAVCAQASAPDRGVEVHRLPDHFGPRGLARLQHLIAARGGDRILVQYVPHAFGMKAMNLPFCLFLLGHRRRAITVMFHEVAFPFVPGQPLPRRVLAAVTRVMAMLVARAASRIFVATAAWQPILARIAPGRAPFAALPVPSNVPVINDRAGIAALRTRLAPQNSAVVGHFGTYGEHIATALEKALTCILQAMPHSTALLVGRNSCEFRSRMIQAAPALAARVRACGPLSAEDLSRHLSACDVMVQPYPDGISTRRGSAMAVLAHGRAMATTCGTLTEPIWAESSAVRLSPSGDPDRLAALALELARDESAQERLGCAARHLYDDRFALRNTIAALRAGE